MLPDGRYDVFVVDAGAGDDGTMALSLVVIAGPHKGEVVELRAGAGQFDQDEVELIGLPGALLVENSVPAFDAGG